MEKNNQLTEDMLEKIENILNSHEYMRNIDKVDELIKILEEKYDIQID